MSPHGWLGLSVAVLAADLDLKLHEQTSSSLVSGFLTIKPSHVRICEIDQASICVRGFYFKVYEELYIKQWVLLNYIVLKVLYNTHNGLFFVSSLEADVNSKMVFMREP